MGTKHIHNPGPNVMFVGSKMIPPGEGRDIDERDLPPEHRDPQPFSATPSRSLDDDLRELMAHKVGEVVPQLPNLSLEALERLAALEQEATKPRSSLLAAVVAEQLKRASVRADGGTDGADQAAFEAAVESAYQQQLAALTPEQLAAIGEEAKADLRAQVAARLKAQG